MIDQATVESAVDDFQAALADDSAFESWYRRVLPRVYGYVLARCGHDPHLAEDLTQQTFIAAIQARSRYDGRSDITTWLCGIARHKLADHYRALEREERRGMRLTVREVQVAGAAADVASVDDRASIAEAFRTLPAAQRAVLAFVVLDDLPVKAAARLMGKSTGATQSLLYRARAGFRQAFREDPTDG